ncbi:hypothetical protein BCY84_06405 [Trypanosoma cruzi cruzi]|nr:hypothetical protein BCY84_06405 [Trypanosoma cruzi cruzi]
MAPWLRHYLLWLRWGSPTRLPTCGSWVSRWALLRLLRDGLPSPAHPFVQWRQRNKVAVYLLLLLQLFCVSLWYCEVRLSDVAAMSRR